MLYNTRCYDVCVCGVLLCVVSFDECDQRHVDTQV